MWSMLWNSHSMDTEMLYKVQALPSGFGIWKPGARQGIAELAVAVCITPLHHLIEIERWGEVSSG